MKRIICDSHRKNKGKTKYSITIDDIEFLYANSDDEYIEAVENGLMPSYLYGSMFPEKEQLNDDDGKDKYH